MSYGIRDSNGNILYSVEDNNAINSIMSFESINVELKELKKINDYSNKLNDAINTFNFISDTKAMESFGYIATESFGEKTKEAIIKIIEALKNFFKRFKEFIVSFWTKIKEGFKKIINFFKNKKIKETKVIKGSDITGNAKIYNPKHYKEIDPNKEYMRIRFRGTMLPICVPLKDIIDIVNSGEYHIKLPNNNTDRDVDIICKFITSVLLKLKLEIDKRDVVELNENEKIDLNDHKLVIKENYEHNNINSIIDFITNNFYKMSKLVDDRTVEAVIKLYTDTEIKVQEFLSSIENDRQSFDDIGTKKLLDSITTKKNIIFSSYSELINYLGSLSRIYAGCGLIINNSKPLYKMNTDKNNNYQPIIDTEGRTLIQLKEIIRLSKSEYDEFLKNEKYVEDNYSILLDRSWTQAIDKDPKIREYVRKLMDLCSKRNLKLAKYIGGDNFVIYEFNVTKPEMNANNEILITGRGVVNLSVNVNPNDIKALYHTSFTKGITALHTNKGASKKEQIYYDGNFNRLYVGINEPVAPNGFTLNELISKHLTANIFPELKDLRIYKIDLNSIDKSKIFLDSEHNGNTFRSKKIKGFKRVAAFIEVDSDKDIPCVDVTETEFRSEMKKLSIL